MILLRCSTGPIIGIRDPSSLFLKAFVWENAYTVDFIETFSVYELETDGYSLLR